MSRILTRRRFLTRTMIGVGTLGALPLLASCGGTAAPAATSPSGTSVTATTAVPATAALASASTTTVKAAVSAAKGQTVVQFTMPGAQGAEQTIRNQWVDAFNQRHPNLHVEADFVNGGGSTLDEKIETRIAGGDPPDVLQTDATRFATYVAKNIYRPLDDLITRDKINKDDYFPVFLPAFQSQGRTYGIPKDNGSTALAYNIAHFDAAGLTYPGDNLTWDSMLELARKLTKKQGDKTTQYGILVSTALTNYHSFILQNGGDIFSKDGTSFVMNSPQAAAALQWMADLATKEAVAPTPDVTADIGTEAAFLAGKVSLYYVWASSIGNLHAIKSFDWDIVQLPKQQQRGNDINGAAFPMYTGTKVPDAAWEMCKWTFSLEGERIFVIGPLAKDVPSLKALQPELLKEPPPPKNQKAKFDALAYGTSFHGVVRWNEINDQITKQLDDVWRGKTTAQAATNTLKPVVDGLLKG